MFYVLFFRHGNLVVNINNVNVCLWCLIYVVIICFYSGYWWLAYSTVWLLYSCLWVLRSECCKFTKSFITHSIKCLLWAGGMKLFFLTLTIDVFSSRLFFVTFFWITHAIQVHITRIFWFMFSFKRYEVLNFFCLAIKI